MTCRRLFIKIYIISPTWFEYRFIIVITFYYGDHMDNEPVTVEEVEEYEEDYDDHYGGRRFTAGPIIAIAVVVVILLGVGFYFFYGTDVDSVTVIRAEEFEGDDGQYQGIEIELRVFSGGAQSINGNGRLDIIFDGQNVYSATHKVKENKALLNVGYEEFAMENGYYEIKFSMEGVSDTLDNPYYVRHIPSELNLDFTTILDDETMEESRVLLVTPRIQVEVGTRNTLVEDYNKHFTISLTTENPYGESTTETKLMYEWHKNMSTLQIDISQNIMGNYTVTAEFENLLVKSNSPYRTLSSDPEGSTAFINKAPLMGRIDHSPSRISRGTQMELTVRATDPDENGGIDFFIIDWGDPDYEEVTDIVYVGGTSSERGVGTHTYNSIGSYTITVIAGDNGYVDESNPNNILIERKFVEVDYVIDVTLI